VRLEPQLRARRAIRQLIAEDILAILNNLTSWGSVVLLFLIKEIVLAAIAFLSDSSLRLVCPRFDFFVIIPISRGGA
jgi:hypothetical protein